MNRLICGMLSLALCLAVSVSLAEEQSSVDDAAEPVIVMVDIKTDEPEEQPQEDSAEQIPEESEADSEPLEDVDISSIDVRWSYPVSLTTLQTPQLLLVNADNPLDESYKPDELVKVKNVKRATSAAVMLDETAAQALKEMFDEAKLVKSYTYTVLSKSGKEEQREATYEDGMILSLKSGYRSYGSQATIYANHLANNNNTDDGYVAKPGESEHQTGLSADILNTDYAQRPRMTQDFKWTPEAQWMKENSRFFGFILRYTEEEEAQTGIRFEPWHFRYVGREAAGYIMANDMTLESFTAEWQAALDEFLAKGGSIQQQLAYELSRLNAPPESHVLEEYGEDGDAEVTLEF